MLIILDLRSLFQSAVSRISVADFIIFAKKIYGFINVMDICCYFLLVWNVKGMQTELFQHVRQGIAVADAQRVDAAAGNDEVVFHGDVLDLAPAETTAQGIDDIRRMVGRADELGLELIPVVSNLGHTQRFLRHPELLHLAELRGGIAGRFTPAGKPYYIDVCPSLEETYTFFDRYITEAA